MSKRLKLRSEAALQRAVITTLGGELKALRTEGAGSPPPVRAAIKMMSEALQLHGFPPNGARVLSAGLHRAKLGMRSLELAVRMGTHPEEFLGLFVDATPEEALEELPNIAAEHAAVAAFNAGALEFSINQAGLDSVRKAPGRQGSRDVVNELARMGRVPAARMRDEATALAMKVGTLVRRVRSVRATRRT